MTYLDAGPDDRRTRDPIRSYREAVHARDEEIRRTFTTTSMPHWKFMKVACLSTGLSRQRIERIVRALNENMTRFEASYGDIKRPGPTEEARDDHDD